MTSTISGTDSDDFLHAYASASHHVLSGGRGNDHLHGASEGNNTFLFKRGDGQDFIRVWTSQPGSFDVLRFGEGISSDAVTLTRENDHLVLDLGQGDRVTIMDYFRRPDYGSMTQPSVVEEIRFDDGTAWDLYEVLAQTAPMDRPPAVTYGSSADEVFADNYSGGQTYVFGPGVGQDVLMAPQYSWGAEGTTLVLKGVLEGGVTFSHAEGSNDLLMHFKGSNDQVTIKDYYDWSNYTYAQQFSVVFADGARWGADALRSQVEHGQWLHQTVEGTPGDDQLNGLSGLYTVLDAGAGNDFLGGTGIMLGGAGEDYFEVNDAYVDGGGGNDFLNVRGDSIVYFGRGSGQDRLAIHDDSRVNVHFAEDILPADLQVNKLVPGVFTLQLRSADDQLMLQNFIGQQVTLRFADGTVWDTTHLDEMPVRGTGQDDFLGGTWSDDRFLGLEGNDHLWGDNGDDMLNGGQGHDRLDGGSGRDTYVFSSGDGFDLVGENWYWNAEQTILRFGSGIRLADISASNQYGHLMLQYGADDRILLGNFDFSGDPGQVPLLLQFDNGETVPYAALTLIGTPAW